MSVPLGPNDPAYWMLEEGRKKVESGEGIKTSSNFPVFKSNFRSENKTK